MIQAAKICLRRYREADRKTVLAMSVTEDQSAFVEPLAETLSDALSDTLSDSAAPRDNFVMEADGGLVGFFQVDSASGRQRISGALELHEVSIDAKHQGKGYGKAFMAVLKPFLLKEYPAWEAVCLTVNCKNIPAYRLYQLGGFGDTGLLHLHGRSGPQHIMSLSLRQEPAPLVNGDGH